MRALEETRASLQITPDVIDFLVNDIRRVDEPVAIIAYGSRAQGKGNVEQDGVLLYGEV